MKKIKILNLVEYFNLGGIERLLEQLALNFGKEYELSFYSYESTKLEGIGLSLYERGYEVLFSKKKKGYDFKLLFTLINFIKKNEIDIVHTHDFGPIEYAVLIKLFCPGVKLIHTQHTLHHFVINKKYTMFFQLASIFYSKMLCVSNHVKDELIRFCPISKTKLYVIHNGVDTDYFKKSNTENLNQDVIKLVSVSRISKEKNLGFTLKALCELKKQGVAFEFHHAGSGDIENEQEINELIKMLDLGSHVYLHGFQSDCRTVLDMGDVFVSSSITEGHPVSVLEAMSLNKICVVSDINPHQEINSGEFLLFNNEKEVELVSVLIKLKKYFSKMLITSKNNRKYVEENYSLDLMIKNYSSQYNKVLNI